MTGAIDKFTAERSALGNDSFEFVGLFGSTFWPRKRWIIKYTHQEMDMPKTTEKTTLNSV